jgi:hypothetical protein
MMFRLGVALCICISFFSCDPCNRLDCVHGTCENRSCQCDEGYLGTECSVQAKPERITIVGMHFENLPDEVFGDVKWDDDTTTNKSYLPDVIMQLRFGTSQDVVFTSVERYMNAEAFEFVFDDAMNIHVSGAFPELRLTLADLDLPAPTKMYVMEVAGYYSPVRGFPTSFRYEDKSGASVVLDLVYTH